MMPAGPARSPRNYVYFPGCSLAATGVAYDESLKTLFRLLDLTLEELQDWNCCGATSYMCIDEGSAFLLSARNLSIAHQMGAKELLAPCSACYLVLRKTQDYAQHNPADSEARSRNRSRERASRRSTRCRSAIRSRCSTTTSAWPASSP